MRDFSVHPLVSSDIDECGEYIARDNPVAGYDVMSEILGTMRKIERNPEAFPTFTPKTFRHETLRRAVCESYPSYLVFFELWETETRILYVHHAARDFESRHREERRD